MKLAVCFTVFNGLELLESAVENITNQADKIIICYQDVSNRGEYCPHVSGFMLRFLNQYKCHVIKYETDLNLNTKENERKKHQMMIDYAKTLDATHFLLTATDHFYKEDEIIFAKKVIKALDYDVTLTAMYTYYKFPTWQLTPIEDYYMPFICKLYPETKIERVRGFPVRVDPSVQINTCKTWHLFPQDQVMLHHYSMIRVDIQNKFRNAAASIRWSKEQVEDFINEFENYDLDRNPGISYFNGRKIKVVDDYFSLLPS
jgi:hypothetical protein